MNDKLLVDEGERVQYACDEEASLSFIEDAVLHYMEAQVTSLVNVHCQV